MKMNIRAKRAVALATATALAATLAACASSDSDSGSSSGDGTVSGEVSLLTPIFEGSTGKELLEGTLLPEFYEMYPDVKVNIDYSSYSKLNTKLTTSVASGLVPDVMLMGVGWIENFAKNGVLADLSSLGLTEEELSATHSSMVVNAGIYDNKVYAVPIMLDARFGVARMDLLEEAGYDHTPTSIEELREMAKALTVRDASGTMTRAGFDLQSNDSRQVFETFLFSGGGDLFNEDITAPAFNSEAGVEALQLMSDLVLVDKVEDVGYSSTDATVNPLINGRAAMGLAHNNLWTQTLEADPEMLDNLEPFLIPGDDPSMFFGGTLATMSSKSKNPEAAQALLEFLTSAGPALAANEQRGNIPALDELLTSDYVTNNRFVQFAMENLDVAKHEGGPAEWLEIRGNFTPAIESALLGQTDAKSALDDLAATSLATMDSN
ncbi:multiple sugar transport system substrate-binding protein [Sanguibacter antarcticus]|uniref:Multiple sugar transport system substrate-binding protein n=1 Tax=Sanguibacter antarcticus TaxID=372484 RepID=A0A2A9DZZ2_9MICO|nr:multiple sugar transport system substrate-binding protein [Sanguibacter antarcticus]